MDSADGDRGCAADERVVRDPVGRGPDGRRCRQRQAAGNTRSAIHTRSRIGTAERAAVIAQVAGRSGRTSRSVKRARPHRSTIRIERLGVRWRRHLERPRPRARQSAFSVVRRQSLLAGAPDDPRPSRRDGRIDRSPAAGRDRVQSRRGVDTHGIDRPPLHPVRADAGPGRSDEPHRRRQAGEDAVADRALRSTRRRRCDRVAGSDPMVEPLGPAVRAAARRPQLDRDDGVCNPRCRDVRHPRR